MEQLSSDQLRQLVGAIQTMASAIVSTELSSNAEVIGVTNEDWSHDRSLTEAMVLYFVTGDEISLLFQGEGDEKFGGINHASDYLAEAIDLFQYLLTNSRVMKVAVPEDSLEIQSRIQTLVNRL